MPSGTLAEPVDSLVRQWVRYYAHWLNYTPICSVTMLVLYNFMFLWRSTKSRGEDVMSDEISYYVVDATENSKGGGVAAEVCSSQTGV